MPRILSFTCVSATLFLLYIIYSISTLLLIAFPAGLRGFTYEDENGNKIPAYEPLWPESHFTAEGGGLDVDCYLSSGRPGIGGARPRTVGGHQRAQLLWSRAGVVMNWDVQAQGYSTNLTLTQRSVGGKMWSALLLGKPAFLHCYLSKPGQSPPPPRDSHQPPPDVLATHASPVSVDLVRGRHWGEDRAQDEGIRQQKGQERGKKKSTLQRRRGDFFSSVHAASPLVDSMTIARVVRVPRARLVFPWMGNCGCGTLADMKEKEELEKRELEEERAKTISDEPVPHWRPRVAMRLMTDRSRYPHHEVPPLIGQHLLLDRSKGIGRYLPPLYADPMDLTSDKMLPLNDTITSLPLNITLLPSGIGKWQMSTMFAQSLELMESHFGAGEKDSDDIRRLVSDTHPVVLLLIMTVSLLHLLFDCLAFKSDIGFWRELKTMKGLSSRAVVSSCFCQFVVLLFLHHGDASLLVLGPAAFGVLVQIWKAHRVIGMLGRPGLGDSSPDRVAELDAEQRAAAAARDKEQRMTAEIDRRASNYLGLCLYPLALGYAMYSLLCTTHEGWYSWGIHSAVSLVYTFGFIMMTPQLFINYKLKSVAHLPWRFLCYRALNTFIDDIFAFVITMPTMHRLSCFRDDLVFFIFMYQRWIYPEDFSRAAMGVTVGEKGNDNKDKTKTMDEVQVTRNSTSS